MAELTTRMVSITTPAELERALREGQGTASGQYVNVDSALRVAAVMACVKLRAGAVANMPLGINERVDDRTRRTRTDLPIYQVLNRRPNRWQRPAEFKRMLESHVLLRGNGYALKSKTVRGDVQALIPLNPDRMKVSQLVDSSLSYAYTPKSSGQVVYRQDEIFHLRGFTLDGIIGLNPLAFMRESIGASLAMERHGATVFSQGANVTGAFKLPAGRTLGKEQKDDLRNQLDEYRAGGSRDGKVIVLEDGLEFQQMALTAEDAQWLEARKFSRGDIAMFFGVPPHMIGDTDKGTSWGTGLEAQAQGFVTYTLEDSLTAWEEAIGADCIDWQREPNVYARFNRNALVRGDMKTRWEAYVKALQWGIYSPNEVRALEDQNPRESGDTFYDPPNTAGTGGGASGDTSNVQP